MDVREIAVRTREVISSPKEFFGKAKKERDWKKAFAFLLVVSALGHVLTALYNILVYPLVAPLFVQFLGVTAVEFGASQVLLAATISFILTMGMSVIWGAALKVWLALFKTKSTFAEAFRVMVYSRTPNYLVSWLPFVNLVAALYSFYLLIVGLEAQYNLSRRKSIVIVVSSVIAVFVLTIIAFSLIPTL